MRDDPDETTADPDALSRRELLALAGSAAAAGLAGCNQQEAETTTTTTGTTTTTETTTAAPEWSKAEARMTTPWFEDVGPENAHPEYPRPQMVRERWQNLNGVWEFDSQGVLADPAFGEPLGERILVPFPVESPLSGIGEHERNMLYRRTFTVPDGWDGRVLLHLERVDWEATVYLNGEQVARHRGGYDAFSVDVTDHLVDGEQELFVKVFDPTDEGTQAVGKQETESDEDIFFTPTSGIWDTVWLEPVPETHVEGLDLTPDLDREALRVTADVTAPGETTVEAVTLEGDQAVGRVSGDPNAELELPVEDPTLWSPENPHLYDLEVRVVDGGTVVDEVESYFGMRSLGTTVIDGVRRPTLNGEFVFHNGIYDQGFWPDGVYTPPTEEARKFNVQTVKDLGFNTLRKHIKVESKRWFYWTDRIGLLVWQDIPQQPLGKPLRNENAREQFETELRRMVRQNDNHPSMAVWVPANEGWGFGKQNADRIRETVEMVEEMDGEERIVNPMSGINTCNCDPGNGDVTDIHIYRTIDRVPTSGEERFSAVGESSAGWVPIPDHMWGYGTGDSPGWQVQRLIDRAETNREYMTEQGLSATINTQVTDTEHHWQGVLTYDRAVLKPERVSDDAVERIREANRELIAASREL